MAVGKLWDQMPPLSREETAAPKGSKMPPAPVDWAAAFTPGRLAVLIVLLLLVEYPEVILGSHSFFNNDFGLFTYPVVRYLGTSIWRGEIPLWNPLSNCGIPFLAQWNTTVCYPPTWLCLFCPLPWSLNYFCLGHLVLAGLGMYWLALRWTADRFAASVAGLSFALNGLTLGCLIWTSNLAALAWMPLTVLCVERGWREGGRRLLVAALVGALQMLAGAPEIIFLTWLLLGTIWLAQVWRRTVPRRESTLRLIGIVAFISGLAAVQVLPFLELLRYSDRDAGQNSGAWSMPTWGWANFLVPLFRCSRSILGPYFQINQQWISSYYPGIGVVALAVVATRRARMPRVWWLIAVALGGMVLALGENSFLYAAVKRIFPAFGLARYPIKFVVPTLFALPLLAGFAVAGTKRLPGNESSLRTCLVSSGAILLALLVFISAAAWLLPFAGESLAVTAANAAGRAIFLALILGALFLQTKSPVPSRQHLLGLGVLLLLGLDCLTHAPRQNPTLPVRAYGPLDLGMSRPPRLGESRAMVSAQMQAVLARAATPDPFKYYVNLRRSLFEDCNLSEDVPKVNGFFSLHLRDEAAVETLLYSTTNIPTGLGDFLGVSQVSSATAWFEWTPRENFLPWATAGQQPIFADAAETLKAMAAPDFDPRRTVFLPSEARGSVVAIGASNATVTAHYSPHEIHLQITTPAPVLAVVAQSLFPAWRAYIDGKPARIWRANYAFQAVEVPSGRHAVRLAYQDRWFELGAAISGLTMLAWIASCFRMGRSPHSKLSP